MSAFARLTMILAADGASLTSVLSRAVTEVSAFEQVILSASKRIGDLFTGSVDEAAKFETTTVSFDALTGSAQTAAKTLKELSDFSAHTPFQFNDLTSATQKLMVFGFQAEEAVGMVKQLSNLAVANPAGAAEGLDTIVSVIGKIRSQGSVTSRELRTLASANISLGDAVAKHLGVDTVTAMRLLKTDAVSGADAIRSLLELSQDERFGGLVEKQSQTLTGLRTTLTDNIQIFKRILGQQLIESFDLKGGVKDATAFVEKLQSGVLSLKGPLDFIGAIFVGLRDSALSLAEIITDKLSKAVGGWGADWGTVNRVVLDMLEQLTQGVVAFARTLLDTFADIVIAVKNLNGITGAKFFTAEERDAISRFGNDIKELGFKLPWTSEINDFFDKIRQKRSLNVDLNFDRAELDLKNDFGQIFPDNGLRLNLDDISKLREAFNGARQPLDLFMLNLRQAQEAAKEANKDDLNVIQGGLGAEFQKLVGALGDPAKLAETSNVGSSKAVSIANQNITRALDQQLPPAVQANRLLEQIKLGINGIEEANKAIGAALLANPPLKVVGQ